jgi:hypothetical protein
LDETPLLETIGGVGKDPALRTIKREPKECGWLVVFDLWVAMHRFLTLLGCALEVPVPWLVSDQKVQEAGKEWARVKAPPPPIP